MPAGKSLEDDGDLQLTVRHVFPQLTALWARSRGRRPAPVYSVVPPDAGGSDGGSERASGPGSGGPAPGRALLAGGALRRAAQGAGRRRRQAVSNPLVLAVFAEVEERKAQLPALLRRQDPGGSGRLGRRQLGEALGAAGVKLSAER